MKNFRKIPENFYPRIKIFRNFPENFCPMYVRYVRHFIWVGQNFLKFFVLGQKSSENLCPRTK